MYIIISEPRPEARNTNWGRIPSYYFSKPSHSHVHLIFIPIPISVCLSPLLLLLLLTGHPRASHNIQSISEHPWSILRLLPSCLLRLGLTVPSRNPIFDALAPSSRAAPISSYRRDFRCSQVFFIGSAESTCDLTSLCVFLGRLLTTILEVSAMAKKTSVPSNA